jgi:hypothetical protein
MDGAYVCLLMTLALADRIASNWSTMRSRCSTPKHDWLSVDLGVDEGGVELLERRAGDKEAD